MLIVEGLLLLRNQLKLYHWQTKSHSRHISSDKLVASLDDLIDKFIETMQGGKKDIVKVNSGLKFRNLNDREIVEFIKNMMKWLEQFETKNKIIETDLLNIRDEILGTLRQGLYLFDQQ